ncbi:uncharacterized protein LOC123659081 [Melitaea cinxia]|uniref:uncharacterized protein LOC123659081 n=1 Tax=Melitaea cinxia TaxID=113334 RepID=UPI001E26FA7F|nr:uncharacterized protein LOC123659081 [Melitaea cinxia]
MYRDFINEYESLGHMTRVNKVEYPNLFLPYHGVFKEHSSTFSSVHSTTKLRVVFDASATTTSSKSLNDIQYPGPALQNDIPRLELCGALLGAKLYKKIIDVIRLTFSRVIFWTDSTIVIGWVKMSPHLLKPFVQNRVTELNELTGDSEWLHVSSENNPADLLSRGLAFDSLINCELWWNGPSYLQCHNNFNSLNNNIINLENLPDLKSNVVHNFSSFENLDFIQFNKYSSFTKLKRVWAYVLRFINNVRGGEANRYKTKQTGSLSVSELEEAQYTLIRFAQMQSFPTIYDNLLNERSYTGNNKELNRVSGLNVFLDDKKLIRVGGRLRNASNFDFNKKHPFLMCDPTDFTPLTPGHFLTGRPLTSLPCETISDATGLTMNRYRRIEQLRQQFWRRWSREYIGELQQRTKWKTHHDDLTIDHLVLIKDENLPPLKWRLGRITRIYPGTDGVTRVADIRTATGTTRRAFSKICPLPLQPSNDEA